MEATKLSSNLTAFRKQLAACAFLEAAALNTLLAIQQSLACLLMMELRTSVVKLTNIASGSSELLNDAYGLPDWTEKRFPMDELRRLEKPGPENKDKSDTEDDDEDDEEPKDQDDDDDAGDEDFSGEGGSEDEGDLEDDVGANGEGGSDEEDEDEDNGDDDEEGEEDDEDDEEEEDEEEDQPPAKKRK